MSTRYFRAGIGIVLYTPNGEIAIFRNSAWPEGIYELPQGGIATGEYPEDALWRELMEEVGLTEDDVSRTAEFPRWMIYQEHNSEIDPRQERLGQAHRWFFLELKPETNIDLSRSTDNEFTDFKFTTWEVAIAAAKGCKAPVYRKLQHYYEEEIAARKNQS
ncbi:MAG: hypothetical protein RLZZ480_100 [Candidatus Parcubacteria bacterium]|jgi:putative (di)nucleoside polyphosphate hydrolase